MGEIQQINGFRSRVDLIADHIAGRNVLHLGAVGHTCADTEVRVEQGMNSLHATVTKLAEHAVGVDSDEASVRLLTERGVFDNLVHADATTMTRADVDLPSVDVVLAGDIIEHLTEPGLLFDTVDRVSDPGSILLISTLNALGLSHTLRNLRGKPLEEGDHVCSFTPQTFSHIIERKGWVVDEMWTCYQPLAQSINPRSFALARRAFEFVPRLGGSLLAVCHRGN